MGAGGAEGRAEELGKRRAPGGRDGMRLTGHHRVVVGSHRIVVEYHSSIAIMSNMDPLDEDQGGEKGQRGSQGLGRGSLQEARPRQASGPSQFSTLVGIRPF